MPRFILAYIRRVDAMNRFIGRFAMYLIFALVGVLLWSTLSKAFFTQASWTLEAAQFVMVSYFVLGGPYSVQLDANVRMDLFYGEWSPRAKAKIDAVTVLCLMFYLGVLLYGGLDSFAYSLGRPYDMTTYDFLTGLAGTVLTQGFDAAGDKLGYLERSPSPWRPYLWPVRKS